VRRLAAEGATLRIAVRSPDRARSALRAADLDRVTVLRGDAGAKQLLAQNERALVKVPVGDPGVIRDIDTPGDLAPPLRI